ncbi:hypothetical protein B2J93_3877 [Marssonina coronariae]|uniref:HTH APSES-type domain-containing protein n=1 Tax=Diplocarpon coronariae TaxID=2795749 RepID=A0A218YV93_9HELO|nr:hypothetical protein B2J93_3877 [Marssonina coronariae]
MVKPVGPGVFSATYSNIPVYEFQFGEGLKEHVMRRRGDDWINATHILKAAGFDKPARTRILEREVQKETHEKVQGGYGKYQGTWVPLEQGEALAQRNNVYEKLRTIFEFTPGNLSPPPAPKHTTAKPKQPKKPAVPKFAIPSEAHTPAVKDEDSANSIEPVTAPQRMIQDDYDDASQMDNESIADDTTVASASFMGEDDRYDMVPQSTGNRKRKREENYQSASDRDHVLYSDELLDYFMLAHTHGSQGPKPEPPVNFRPDWIIDSDSHTALHWAAAMGDVEIMRELKRFGANPLAQNIRGETPLMRCVLFTNCLDKQTMPAVVHQLIDTIDCVDFCHSTALHHAAAMTVSRQKHQCARYYLDIILNKMLEVLEPEHLSRIIDARDVNGNTAIHIAAKNKARKCVRALMGRGARTNIRNIDGITAEDLIQELNESRRQERQPQGSSSPYGPDSRSGYEMPEEPNRNVQHHVSEAAMSIENRVTSIMLEKFSHLANSFDDELIEKETSEREARRILKSTIQELESSRHQIQEIVYLGESSEVAAQSKEQLAQVEQAVTALIEKQQQIRLWSHSQLQESSSNGHLMTSEDDVEEQIRLAKALDEEVNKRGSWVVKFRDALSVAGAGEKGDQYRRLLSKCLGEDAENMDENIDILVKSLNEEEHGQDGETVAPDGS